jgi:hypothetical protein
VAVLAYALAGLVASQMVKALPAVAPEAART